MMRNGLLVERYETEEGNEVVRTLSYDSYGKTYRVTQIDSSLIQMDVREGGMEDGRRSVSNVKSGTTQSGFGMTFHGRIEIFDITADGFKLEQATSIDGGENWSVNVKATYSRSDG